MLSGILTLWFLLTAASVVFVVWDSVTNTPTSWVQKLAWVLVTVYTGPVGLFVYFLACRSPGPGMHDPFTRATWKQSVNSEMHCLAGDATGIVVAAAIVPAFHLPNGWDLVLEYGSAFVVGLLVFQALMMIGMYGGNYLLAVRKTFFAETVSMNAVMVGMIPTMVVLMDRLPGAREPWNPGFWFVMGMASIVGGLTAFPMNRWLVANHLKHGCMTLPDKDNPAPNLGLTSPEAAARAAHAGHAMAPSPGAHAGHASQAGPATAEPPSSHASHAGHAMTMREPTWAQSLAWTAATFAAMLAAAWLTSRFAPISFS
jgi:hypothetical protein